MSRCEKLRFLRYLSLFGVLHAFRKVRFDATDRTRISQKSNFVKILHE